MASYPSPMKLGTVAEHQLCLLAAPCFSLATWVIFLRRYTVSGDYAVVVHAACFAMLYLVLRASPLSDIALRTSVEMSIAYAFTLALVTVTYRLSPWHPLASYPGPLMARMTSLWLSYVSSTGKRYLILDALHARYGPFLRIGPDTLSINSPRAVPLYLNAEKGKMYRLPGHHAVTSLFFKPDRLDAYRARRRDWSRMFATDGLAELAPPLERRTVQLLRTLERRQAETSTGFADLYEAVYHWAYDFMGDMVHLYREAIPGHTGLVNCPWLIDIIYHLPFTGRWHLHHKNAAGMMGNRVKTGEVPGYRDLTSYLIEGGASWDDLQAESIVAVVGGGLDSTSISVTFAIFFLLANPVYYHRLRKELDEAFPDPTCSLSLNALAGLEFLDCVINESLRLGPSPYYYPRIVPRGGGLVDGKHIPEGTTIALASYSQHISPENFWPSPLEFLPDRWRPDGLGPETRTNKTMLTSFAYGRHACIGRGLAYHQMRLAVARLLLAFDVGVPGDFDPVAVRAGIRNIRTTFLEQPLYVKVIRRPGVDLDALVNAAM